MRWWDGNAVGSMDMIGFGAGLEDFPSVGDRDAQGFGVLPTHLVAEARDRLNEPMKRHLRSCVDCKHNPALTVLELMRCTVEEIDHVLEKVRAWEQF